MKLIGTFILGAILGAAILFFALVRTADNEAATVAPPVLNVPAPAATATAPASTESAAIPAPPPPVDASLADAELPEQPDYLSRQTGGIAPSGAAGVDSTNAKLMIPVEGIKAEQLSDTFGQPRGKERQHEAMDIMAAKGSKVVAVADGKIVKLFNSKPGGLTVYQFDPTEKYAYYYAHLDKYADGIKEGQQIKQGDVIGYVGNTGNADPKTPHLHFAVFELTPQKEWWKGKAINPLPMMR
jgi:murein DD-endopeptidase MepM/ murein hydrolase activator NlpD